MIIKHGDIVLTKLNDKVIPYAIVYDFNHINYDVYCILCGKLFATNYDSESLIDMFNDMDIVKVVNVEEWLTEMGYTPNECK